MGQLDLFEWKGSLNRSKKESTLVMSQSSLIEWKWQIFNYQQQERNQVPPQQTSLFELNYSHGDPHNIDPFELRLHSSEFYRMPDYGDLNCLYFVIDTAMPLLLYIGETKQTPKARWATHDCRDYILNYIELQRRYHLKVAVNTAFWWDTPTERKARQKLEKELILKWRTPFNKENWDKFGQPFGK